MTFTYNANFFLFTTLEIARPIAHGRMQPPMPQVPVLTGMPVSGMAYLDRPNLAGYFIFPDLSVRHEGRYRLSFNLYEETRHAKDADAEPSTEEVKPQIPVAGSPDSSFHWRLEVKSTEFTVFSAKKFPGLHESTGLSKMVADQGCRVRIRRDVRMRRRESKPNGEYEAAGEEEYARVGRTPSIQDYRERTRSVSNESADRQAYPGMERRMSGEYPRPYPHSAPRPQSYLTFGGPAANQYPAPPPRFAQPAPPAPPSYPQGAAPHPHQVQYRQPAPPPQDVFNRQSQPLTTSSTRGLQRPRDSYESKPYAPPESPIHQQLRQNHPAFGKPGDLARGPALPPMLFISTKARQTERMRTLPPIQALSEAPRLPEPSQLVADCVLPPLPKPAPADPTTTVTKRTHQAAFDPKARALARPLFNGMRPEDSRSTDLAADTDSGEDDDDKAPAWEKDMVYKRADGNLRRILDPPS